MEPLIRQLLLSAKKQELAALAQLHELVDFVTLTGDFIHQLQRTRGLCNRVLYTPTPACVELFAEQNVWLANGVDQLRLAVAALLKSDYLLPARLQNAIAQALQATETLQEIRQQVADMQALQHQSTAPCDGYSLLIRCWLAVVVEVTAVSGVPQISAILLSLIYLLQAKEFAGQERAYGVIALSGKADGVLIAEQLSVLQCAQRDNLDALARIISNATFQQLQQALDELTDFARLRQLIQGLCQSGQASPALADLWFELATRRIDLMHQMMSELMGDLTEQVRQSRLYLDQQKQLAAVQRSGNVVNLAHKTGMSLALSQEGTGWLPQSLLTLLREQSQYIAEIEMQLHSSQAAVQELKLVQRAKLLLIERFHCGEQQAHHQLQKLAMDQQLSLAAVAANLVEQCKAARSQQGYHKEKSAKST